MDLSTLKELGVAGITIGALGFVCVKLIKEVADSRKNYTTFVNENNHTTTELVREATAAIVETRNAIKAHNDVLKLMIDRIKKNG